MASRFPLNAPRRVAVGVVVAGSLAAVALTLPVSSDRVDTGAAFAAHIDAMEREPAYQPCLCPVCTQLRSASTAIA
jgi:hypothetical protein